MISVTIPTNPTQDEKLERIRQRLAAEGTVYADVDAMARQMLIDRLTTEVANLDADDQVAEQAAYRNAYHAATPEVKAQVRALLGIE